MSKKNTLITIVFLFMLAFVITGCVPSSGGESGNGEEPTPRVSAITIIAKVIGEDYVEGTPLPNFEGVYVELETATEGAEIYYTLDGTAPSKTNGTEYTTGFAIDTENPLGETITLKVVAVKDDYIDSDVATLEIEFMAEEAD